MQPQFDWRLEDTETGAIPPRPPGRRPGRRWGVFLVLVLLLAISAAGLVRQGRSRAGAILAAVEADVAATHRLLMEANGRGDADLAASFLATRPAAWRRDTLADIAAEQLLERVAWGLAPTAAELTVDPLSVTLSADLSAAVVTQPQTYHHREQTVALWLTFHYRLEDGRWRLATPEQPGSSPETIDGAHFRLTFPTGDRSLATRLASALEQDIEVLCQRAGRQRCARAIGLDLELVDDPASLRDGPRPRVRPDWSRGLALPSPMLFGQPRTEAAIDAWLSAYRRVVLAEVMRQIAGYTCCPHGLFMQALVDHELAQLGVLDWPLEAADYDWLLDDGLDLGEIAGDWLLPATVAPWDATALAARRRSYSLVDFLLRERAANLAAGEESGLVAGSPMISPAASTAPPAARKPATYADPYVMLGGLPTASGLRDWLWRFAGFDGSPEALIAAWRPFVFAKSASAGRAAPPVPWPEQDVLMICDTQWETTLYRYTLARDSVNTVLVRPRRGRFVSLLPLADGTSYLINERSIAASAILTRLTLWQTEQESILVDEEAVFPEPGRGLYLTSRSDPTGRYVLVGAWGGAQGRQLLDLARCPGPGCRLESIGHLPGWPIWSPDGRAMLVQERRVKQGGPGADLARWQRGLYLADEQGRSIVRVAQGDIPTWLSSTEFAFVRLDQAGRPELAVASRTQPPWSLVSSSALAAEGGHRALPVLYPYQLLAHPRRPDQLFLLATAAPDDDGPAFLLRVERRGSEASVQLIREVPTAVQAGFSPDGKWLTLLQTRHQAGMAELLEWETGRVLTTSGEQIGAGWSADGRWLLGAVDGGFLLRAPGHDYRRLFTHGINRCRHVAWAPAATADMGSPTP